MEITRRRFLEMSFYLAGALILGCGRSTTPSKQGELIAYPQADKWPEPFWSKASLEVKEAYRFAVANHAVLQYMPCYCGCVNDGHTSNIDCYVKEFRPDGGVVLDTMSFG